MIARIPPVAAARRCHSRSVAGGPVACPLLLACLVAARPGPAEDSHRTAAMLGPHAAALLVDYFEAYRRDQDVAAFRRNVSARYTEGTLMRLVQSGSPPARRAALLALGLTGGMAASPAVARALRDPDPLLRDLAENALWSIWFRADSPENNATLRRVRALIDRERHRDAIDLASRLIDRAPGFAEAYNQRAIARFALGEFAESALDCRRALGRNPHHIGALSGLAQCELRLGRRAEALAAYRRALELQPHHPALRRAVAILEDEPD